MPIVLLSSRNESDTTDVLYHHNSDISIASIHSYLLHKAAMNHFFILISIPPPSVGGTNSDESIDYPPRCVYNSSEKLYYKAREEES